MKLYVYDHCPYCVRARMIFGLKQQDFQLNVLLNDDEATPISMVGKKVVPILQKADGSYMPESMDIVHYVDGLSGQSVFTGKADPTLTQLAAALDNDAFRKLCSPRFVLVSPALPEFKTPAAIAYFTHKKEASLGSFSQCIADSARYIADITPLLETLEQNLTSTHACNGELSTDDIYLFASLRNLTIVKDLHFPPTVRAYIDKMAQLSGLDLYFDRAI